MLYIYNSILYYAILYYIILCVACTNETRCALSSKACIVMLQLLAAIVDNSNMGSMLPANCMIYMVPIPPTLHPQSYCIIYGHTMYGLFLDSCQLFGVMLQWLFAYNAGYVSNVLACNV